MPFYTDDHNANRLSIDIDLLTQATVENVNSVMNDINSEIDEIEIEKLVPKGKKYPIPNLVSYRVHYDSFLGKKDWIKVDYLCGMNVPISTNDISVNYDLFAFTTDYDMQILSRGSLIGDKLSTLSIGTIGLPEKKFAEIPKQIFDIGSQLRMTTKQDILEIFETFEKFTTFKVTNFEHTPPFTINNVLEKIEQSLNNLFEFNKTAVVLTKNEDDRLRQFMGTYIGNSHIYKRTVHLSNILLILFLIKIIKEILTSKIDKDSASTTLFQVIKRLNKYTKMSGIEIRRESSELLSNSLPEQLLPIKKILRGQPIEYTYLLQQIHA